MSVLFQGVLISHLSFSILPSQQGKERGPPISEFQMIKYSDFSSLWPVLLNLARLQKGQVVVMTTLSGLGKSFSAGLLEMGCVQFNLD